MKTKKILAYLIVSFFIFGNFSLAKAENQIYSINLDKQTIAKGYTVEGFGELKLSLVPGILSQASEVEIVQLNEEMAMPWNLDKISKIYQFEFKNKKAYDNHKPFYIQFSYDKKDNNYKQVYFYDKNYSAWRPLPTRDFPEEKFVRSLIHLPFARIAIFSDSDILTVGQASWYGYKGGNFAASPDFPKGSRLRVYNVENNKFIDVIINDYGPDRSIHPDRVVDLDKIAFKNIANLGQGVVDIKIEPLRIASLKTGKVLGASEEAVSSVPKITSKAAIVINQDSGKTIFKKNQNLALPIASLTKLVAIKVFLDANSDLDRVVAYSSRDEEYNYEWCRCWESARLRVEDGEVLTIKDLIYSSLVGSANNTVETLVRVSGLSRDDFIKKMNKIVKDWGASSTYFVEPTGLAPNNAGSAADYAVISKNVLANLIIRKASTMAKYEFYTINTKKLHRLKNTNKLIQANKFNITGSKTGYLDEAGYCLMTRIKAPSGERIIIVTLGADSKATSLRETEELIRYGIRKL